MALWSTGQDKTDSCQQKTTNRRSLNIQLKNLHYLQINSRVGLHYNQQTRCMHMFIQVNTDFE